MSKDTDQDEGTSFAGLANVSSFKAANEVLGKIREKMETLFGGEKDGNQATK